jgi:hypothetical protein
MLFILFKLVHVPQARAHVPTTTFRFRLNPQQHHRQTNDTTSGHPLRRGTIDD